MLKDSSTFTRFPLIEITTCPESTISRMSRFNSSSFFFAVIAPAASLLALSNTRFAFFRSSFL